MTDEPLRPGQEVLEEAVSDVIGDIMREWEVTHAEVVGVLTIIAARYAHECIEHSKDDE